MNATDEIPEGYLRVTEVLNPFSKLHEIDPQVLANAADRGRRAHKWCTLHALNMLFGEVDADCKEYVESWKTWFDAYVGKVLMPPKRINSPHYRISGEFDLFVKMKGEEGTTLLDIKTPANVSASWQLQTAAYKMLLEDELGEIVDRRIVVMLPKFGGKARIIEHLEHDLDEKKYLNALELYRHFYA